MWKAAGHKTLDSLWFLHFWILSRQGGYFSSPSYSSPSSGSRSVQERLRSDRATTLAHCFSFILAVSGGSSAIKESKQLVNRWTNF
jgi:hypothetical protein